MFPTILGDHPEPNEIPVGRRQIIKRHPQHPLDIGQMIAESCHTGQIRGSRFPALGPRPHVHRRICPEY